MIQTILRNIIFTCILLLVNHKMISQDNNCHYFDLTKPNSIPQDFNPVLLDLNGSFKFNMEIKKCDVGEIPPFDTTDSRNEYEENAQMFIVSEMLKEARKEAKLTQEQLAERAGTKKSYISKIENAKGNIQLSTLIRIFEKGLNRRIGLTFL